ncbi:MAG: hypothetical protein IRZ03_17600 [Acidobacterium ailaaui]|nr:hypothetical protein [Pseudacidobacterium ailaaui]
MKYVLKNEPDFLQVLIGKCWKILRLYEEQSPTLLKHIENTIFKFKGAERTFEDLRGRNDFLNIIVTLNQLYNELSNPIYDDKTHRLIKSQVLECTNTIERLGKKAGVLK